MMFNDIRNGSAFKRKLVAQQLTLGLFITVSGPEVVEISGLLGSDFVIIDTEHTPVGWEKISAMTVSAQYSGTFPIVRPSSGQRDLVTRALDSGARGIMIPQIQNAQQAADACRACRYPPHGVRGAAGTRNFGYGVMMKLSEFIPAANRDVVCILQIETAEAVRNVGAIAATVGLDCLFVGLTDLSVDLGYPGEFSHPDVEKALDAVIAAAKPRGVAIGIPIAELRLAKQYRDRGVSFFATTDRAIFAHGIGQFINSFDN